MKLCIGSYNLQHGAGDLPDLSRIAANIVQSGMEVVGLQEIDQMTDRVGGIDTMKALSKSTQYPYYAFFKAFPYKGGEYGLGILSKYPILKTERFELESNGYEQRVLGYACIDVHGTPLPFFVTHVSYEDKPTRSVQLAQIAEILKLYHNYILTGDFNTFDFAEYVAFSDAQTVNREGRFSVTFPQGQVSIDNIVYRADAWSFDAPQVITESYSDHYALYAHGSRLNEDPKQQ